MVLFDIPRSNTGQASGVSAISTANNGIIASETGVTTNSDIPFVEETIEESKANEKTLKADPGQVVTPYNLEPPPRFISQNGSRSSGGSSEVPVSEESEVLPSAPPLDKSFAGLGDNNTKIPPDTHGAVGPAHLMETLNTEVAIYDKSDGSEISKTSLQSFWASLGTGVGQPANSPFDPKVVYDQHDARFITVAMGGKTSPSSWLLVAVSATPDPTGAWYKWAIDADLDGGIQSFNNWADYPGIGLDDDYLYLTANMFTNAKVFQYSKVWVIPKGQLLTGEESMTLTEFRNPTGSNSTVLPTHVFGESPVQYLVSSGWNSGVGRLIKVYRITFVAGTPTWTDLGFVNVGSYPSGTFPLAPQLGSANLVDTNDQRLMNAVFRDGSIWTTNTVTNDSHTKTEIAWYQIDPANASFVSPYGVPEQKGRISDLNRWYYFPSIAVNSNGDMGIGFSGSSPTEYVSTYYTGRQSTDPSGAIQTVSLLKEGLAPYYKLASGTRNRWGDYSATVIDPSDDSTFWTLQEYASTPVGGSDRWATWWGSFEITPGASTPPTTTLLTSPPSPNGLNGWYRTIPTISLYSNKPGTTSYQWNSTASFNTYISSFAANEGDNTIHYYSEDESENTEIIKSQTIKVDIDAPTAEISNPLPEQNVSSVIPLWAQVDDTAGVNSGIESAQYRVDNQTPKPMSPSDGEFNSGSEAVDAAVNILALSNGQHTISVRGRDKAGNWGEWDSVEVNVENQTMVSEIHSPIDYADTPLSKLIVVKGTAKLLDAGQFQNYLVEYQQTALADGISVKNPVWKKILLSNQMVDNGTLATWNTAKLNGRYKLRLTVFSKDGNAKTAVKDIKIDNTLPKIMAGFPQAGQLLPDNLVSLSAYVKDQHSSMESMQISLNGKNLSTEYIDYNEENGSLIYNAENDPEFFLNWGEPNIVRITARDKAGNIAAYTYNFFCEPFGPNAMIFNLFDEQEFPQGQPVPVVGLVSSQLLQDWTLKYKPVASPNFTTVGYSTKLPLFGSILGNIPALSSGSYDVMLTATNKAQIMAMDTRTIRISPTMTYATTASIDMAFGGNTLYVQGSATASNFGSYKLYLRQTSPVVGIETLVYTGTSAVSDGLLANITSKVNGTFDVILKVYNSAGAIVASNTYTDVEIDSAPPKITSISPANNGHYSYFNPIIIKATDPNPLTSWGLSPFVQGYINGAWIWGELVEPEEGSTAPPAFVIYPEFEFFEFYEGLQLLTIEISDQAGNKTKKTQVINIDTVKPYVNIADPEIESIKGTRIFKGSVYDEHLASYKLQFKADEFSPIWQTAYSSIQNVPVEGATVATWNTSKLNGAYLFRMVAVDKAGNASYFPEEEGIGGAIPVLIDNKAPSFSAIYPTDKSHVKTVGAITVSGAYDLNPLKTTAYTTGINPDNIKLKLNGSETETAAQYNQDAAKIIYDINDPLADGSYLAEFSIPDNAGNKASVVTNFTVDSTDPVAQISLSRASIKSGNKLTIAGKATDKNIASWTLYQKHSSKSVFTKLSSGTANVGNASYDSTLYGWTTPPLTGTYALKLDVVDKAGNTASANTNIIVDGTSNYSNAASISYPASSSIINGKVPVIGSASVAGGFAYYTISSKLSTSSVEKVVYKGTAPVEGGLLATFSTGGLNGVYDIVLRRYSNPAAPVEFGTAVTTENLTIDNAAPVISSISLTGGTGLPGFTKTTMPVIAIKIKENGSGVDETKTKLTLNGSLLELDFSPVGNAFYDSGTDTIYTLLADLFDGKHSVSAKIYDKAANASNALAYQITVDTDYSLVPTQPTAEITYPAEGSYQKSPVPVVGSAFDQNIRDYTLAAKNSATTAYSTFFTGKTNVRDATLGSFKSTDNGEYAIKLTVRDKADNDEKNTSVNIVLDNIAPVSVVTKINNIPIASVTQITGPATLTGKAYDRGGLNDATQPSDSFDGYIIDLGSGSAPTSWNVVFSSSNPVGSETAEGGIGVLNEEVPTGTYTIRVRTFDKTGAVKEFRKTLKIISLG